MMRKKIILGATSALVLLSLAGCGSKKIATMKGGTITVEDFYNDIKSTPQGKQAALQLIVYDAFDKAYGDKVKDSEVTKQWNEFKKSTGDNFKETLEQMGKDEDSYKKMIHQKLAMQAAMKANVKVTDKEIKEVWKTFHPEVSAQIIVLEDKTTAEAVLKDVQAEGADFSKIAKEKSTDTATKGKGGNIKFSSTSTDVPQEVQTAAFALKDGQVSQLISVTDEQGYAPPKFYIVKMVKNKAKGKSLTPYKKQLEKLAEETQLQSQELQMRVIRKVIKDQNVKIEDNAFKGLLDQFTGESKTKKSSSKKTKSSSKKASSKSSESSTSESSSSTESSASSASESSTESTTASSSAAE